MVILPSSGCPVTSGAPSVGGFETAGGWAVLLVILPLPPSSSPLPSLSLLGISSSIDTGFTAITVTVRFCGMPVLFAKSDTVYVNKYVVVVFVSVLMLIILMPFCSDIVNVVLPVISTRLVRFWLELSLMT